MYAFMYALIYTNAVSWMNPLLLVVYACFQGWPIHSGQPIKGPILHTPCLASLLSDPPQQSELLSYLWCLLWTVFSQMIYCGKLLDHKGLSPVNLISNLMRKANTVLLSLPSSSSLFLPFSSLLHLPCLHFSSLCHVRIPTRRSLQTWKRSLNRQQIGWHVDQFLG